MIVVLTSIMTLQLESGLKVGANAASEVQSYPISYMNKWIRHRPVLGRGGLQAVA